MHKIKVISALLLSVALSSCGKSKIEVRAMPAPEDMRTVNEALAKGRMLFERDEFALAADAFRKAVRQDPDNADAYNGLAASYDNLGRFDLSRRYYELALARSPEDGRILRNFARSMLGQGNKLAARRLFAEAAALDLPKAAAIAPSEQLQQAAAEQAAAEQSQPEQPLPEQTAFQPAALPDAHPFQAGQGAVTVAVATAPPQVTIALPAAKPVSPAPTSLFQRIAATVLPTRPHRGDDVSVALDPPARPEVVQAVAAAKAPNLHIMNAVGRKHQAARMRMWLSGNGWNGASIGDSRNKLLRSRILYRARDERAARALASTLPFKPRLQPARGAPALFLMLGRDAVAFDNQLRAPKQG
jgi:Flp pilus assembly protein TadD